MSGGKGGSKPSTTTNTMSLPPWVESYGQQNLNQAADIAARPFEDYAGERVAGLTPDQTAAYNYIRTNMGAGADRIAAAGDAVTGGNLTATAQSLLNPYLSKVEGDTVSNMLRAGGMAQNSLADKAIGAGAFGGSRFGVQSALLDSETQRNIGQAVNQIASQGWDTAVKTALGQAQEVAGLAGAGQQAGLAGASALAGAGGQQQNQAQAQDTAAWQQWQTARDYPLAGLAIREQALASVPYGTTTTSSQTTASGNPIAGGLGGAASGAAIGTSILPGWGTAIGAGLGGLMGLFGSK